MNGKIIQQNMNKVVHQVCKDLSDLELAVLNNVAQLDQSPYNRNFAYEKVKTLFTEQDGSRMHEETKAALSRIVIHRLG